MALAGVMTRFKLHELSGVKTPAQPPALAAIIKRTEDGVAFDPFIKREFSDKERKDLADSGKALPDGSFPIENEQDLHNAIRAVGRAKDEAKAKSHIISRAKSMGMESALPDDWKVEKHLTPLKGFDMTPAELRKSLGLPENATDVAVQNALIAKANAADDEKDKAEKARKAAEEEVDKAKKALEKADRRSKMTEAEKAHTSNMSDADCDDFMSKSKEERDKIMAKSAGDETLVVAGQSIKKSAVGDATFAVLKAQQIQLDGQAAQIKKAEEAAALATFAKRAETDFAHVAGTTDERASLLKAIDGMPAADKALALKNLGIQEKLAKSAFTSIGKSAADLGIDKGDKGDGDEDDAEAKLNKEAEKVAKAAGISFAKAYTQVCTEQPELYAKYTEQKRIRVAKANGGAND